MQRQGRRFDAARREAVDKFPREVQAGGGRRDGARAGGVHRLVALRIGRGVGMRDVGRQRYVAAALQKVADVAIKTQQK